MAGVYLYEDVDSDAVRVLFQGSRRGSWMLLVLLMGVLLNSVGGCRWMLSRVF